jgi:cell division protein FtsQ
MTIYTQLAQWSRLWWFLAALVLTTLFATAFLEKRTSNYEEFTVRIEPLPDMGYLITNEDIQNHLAKWRKGYENTPMKDLPVTEMEAALKDLPVIDEANVYLSASNKLTIKIKQVTPLLRIIDQRGANYYLGEGKRKIPVSKSHTPRIPVVTGDIPMFEDSLILKDNHLFARLFALGEVIKDDPFCLANTEQIHVSQGKITLIPKVGNFHFLLGNATEPKVQMQRLKTFYRDVLPVEGWNTYKVVDLRFKRQIVCRQA